MYRRSHQLECHILISHTSSNEDLYDRISGKSLKQIKTAREILANCWTEFFLTQHTHLIHINMSRGSTCPKSFVQFPLFQHHTFKPSMILYEPGMYNDIWQHMNLSTHDYHQFLPNIETSKISLKVEMEKCPANTTTLAQDTIGKVLPNIIETSTHSMQHLLTTVY